VPIRPEAVIVNTGAWAGVKEAARGGMGVLNCDSKEVLVAEGTEGRVDVEPGTLVCGKDVGVLVNGSGVFVRGCKR
jgi:hypothetical protein